MFYSQFLYFVSSLCCRVSFWHSSTGEGPHSIADLSLQEFVLELLLPQDLFGLLTSPDQVWYNSLRGTEKKILIDSIVLHGKRVRDLVGETLELAEADTLVLDVQARDQLHSLLDRALVVRSNHEQPILIQVLQDVLHAPIVALMCFFNSVTDWRFYSLAGGNGPLLNHVGTSDKLNADVEAHCFGTGDLVLGQLQRSLSVPLERVQNNVLFASVKDVRQLLCYGLDGTRDV